METIYRITGIDAENDITMLFSDYREGAEKDAEMLRREGHKFVEIKSFLRKIAA